jgi:hypothetical protein
MQINRLETVLNREGNLEVFCEVVFDTELYGKLPFGHWLTPSEYATYIADNNSITTIMSGYQTTVEFRKAEELSILN